MTDTPPAEPIPHPGGASERPRSPRGRAARVAGDFAIGFLVFSAFESYGLHVDYLPELAGVAAALIGMTRARGVVWVTGAVVSLILLIVGYARPFDSLIRANARVDALAPAPAVVVLGAFQYEDDRLGSRGQERAVRGYEILKQGYAPTLVLTHAAAPARPWENAVREQMGRLGLAFPVEVVGDVRNTHDEALAVAELARQRGWSRVILVTHPWHMRRAAAVFEKAGVQVTCAPCTEGRYAITPTEVRGDQDQALQDWVREAVGFRVYRFRGWL